MSWIDWLEVILPVTFVFGMAVFTRRYIKDVTSFLSAGRVCGRDCESIRKIVSAQIGKNAMPLNDEMIAPDGRRIIGKKYISDADASKSGACKACLEYAGRIFKWPEEKDKMPVLPRHPIGCKVIAYRNKVNPVGGKAPYTWSNPDKKIFLPKIEKK